MGGLVKIGSKSGLVRSVTNQPRAPEVVDISARRRFVAYVIEYVCVYLCVVYHCGRRGRNEKRFRRWMYNCDSLKHTQETQ